MMRIRFHFAQPATRVIRINSQPNRRFCLASTAQRNQTGCKLHNHHIGCVFTGLLIMTLHASCYESCGKSPLLSSLAGPAARAATHSASSSLRTSAIGFPYAAPPAPLSSSYAAAEASSLPPLSSSPSLRCALARNLVAIASRAASFFSL
jgi:hypothetical protein